MINTNLVFDLGMHRAFDSDFYLNKGFDVVALEANPRLVSEAQEKLAPFIETGQLTIVERAFWSPDVTSVKFFVNNEKDDWSSVVESWSRKGDHEVEEIEVQTTTLEDLFAIKGVPYYIKCDIEGADQEFLRQLQCVEEKPPYVSVEPHGADVVGILTAAGYGSFQLVNQALNGWEQIPDPAREGTYYKVRFHGHMSGLFGRELRPEKWLSADEATERMSMFRVLKKRDPLLAHGWLDVHGRLPGYE